jgi:hypothetical protein
MTFKELQKLIHHRQSESNSDQTRFFDRLKDKPFWIWNVEQHKAEDRRTRGDCCFNHIIGLPKKDEQEKPMFDYEQPLHNLLEIDKKKYIWVNKATGLGITGFFLRYIAWICTHDNSMQGKRVCIVTGPRIDLAVTLVDRLKGLFTNFGVFFDNKETV